MKHQDHSARTCVKQLGEELVHFESDANQLFAVAHTGLAGARVAMKGRSALGASREYLAFVKKHPGRHDHEFHVLCGKLGASWKAVYKEQFRSIAAVDSLIDEVLKTVPGIGHVASHLRPKLTLLWGEIKAWERHTLTLARRKASGRPVDLRDSAHRLQKLRGSILRTRIATESFT